jgi:hypothetical protein
MKKLIIGLAFILFAGVAFGQTLQKGGMVSVHEWTLILNPDVTMDQFLDHWKNNFMPVMKKEMPEMKRYIIKSIGEETKYAGLYYWDSMEEMGKYYNSDGSPTEIGAAAHEKIMPMLDGLSKFGEFTWTVANWIIVE